MKTNKRRLTLILLASIVLLAACGAQPPLPAATNPPQGTPAGGSGSVIPPSGTIVVPPPVGITPGEGSNPTPGTVFGPESVTLADNGRLITLKVGQSFLLNLGMDIYDWNPSISNPDVLGRVMGVLTIKGSQGLFEGKMPGSATLQAEGNPLCASSTPPCMMPSMLFRVEVVVQ